MIENIDKEKDLEKSSHLVEMYRKQELQSFQQRMTAAEQTHNLLRAPFFKEEKARIYLEVLILASRPQILFLSVTDRLRPSTRSEDYSKRSPGTRKGYVQCGLLHSTGDFRPVQE